MAESLIFVRITFIDSVNKMSSSDFNIGRQKSQIDY